MHCGIYKFSSEKQCINTIEHLFNISFKQGENLILSINNNIYIFSLDSSREERIKKYKEIYKENTLF